MYSCSLTFCCRSTLSRYFSCVGDEAILPIVWLSLDFRSEMRLDRTAMTLSNEAMIASRVAARFWSRSTTSGLLALLFAAIELRWVSFSL